MKIFFCSNPINKSKVDEVYEEEYKAASAAGFSVGIIDLEEVEEIAAKAAKKTNNPMPQLLHRDIGDKGSACYRGWMIKPKDYPGVSGFFNKNGFSSVTTTAAYKKCHLFPLSYPQIEKLTARSWWTDVNPEQGINMKTVLETIKPFGSSPVILKDYVKSRKHEWNDACFIPDASNHENVERVVNNFYQRQGENFEGGLVFREFVELENIGTYSKSDLPLSREFRIFFYRGSVVAVAPYWDEGKYNNREEVPLDDFANIAKNIGSKFFAMDVAKRKDGSWMIVEVGDGQVSDIPPGLPVKDFYNRLANFM